MSGTTTFGWPYVTPDDHPLQYPTASQGMANLLETGNLGVIVPSTGWADIGGSAGGMWATRLGPLVVIEFTVKPTADKAVVVGTKYEVAVVPVGFRPQKTRLFPVAMDAGAPIGRPVVGEITALGAVSFVAEVAETIAAASGFVGVLAVYRGA